MIVADTQHGAIVSWLDRRDFYRDVYAQRVSFYGALTPVELGAPRLQNHADRARPNPLNPETRIPYTMASGGRVVIRVFDVGGRLLRTLEDRNREAGNYVARWDGQTNIGTAAASGTYFATFTFPDGTSASQKVTVLR